MAWAAVAKIAVTAAKDERVRKIIVSIFVVGVGLVFLLTASCTAMCGAVAQGGKSVIDNVFGISSDTGGMDAETKAAVLQYQEMNNELVAAGVSVCPGIDSTRLQSVFFVLTETGLIRSEDSAPELIADCFVSKSVDSEGNVTASPIYDTDRIYGNIESAFGIEIPEVTRNDCEELYEYLLKSTGAGVNSGGSGTIAQLLKDDTTPYVGGSFTSPFVGRSWRSSVTSEYGVRIHPITGAKKMHTGLDLAAPLGTPIYAAQSGTVLYVRYSDTGYGYHVVINHGGKITTTYAHCSQILVIAGDTVSQGQMIAKVGSTGDSTGPHLHFEVRVNGVTQSPRSWLP